METNPLTNFIYASTKEIHNPKKKKKSLREIEQQKRESLRKEKGIEKTEILRRERATEKERDSMRKERRESLPKRELTDESLRGARMRGRGSL